jgi:hypothetical protein
MHGHAMIRAPAPSHFSASAEAQIDAAVLRLVDLFARQAARDLAAGAPELMETPDATEPPEED